MVIPLGIPLGRRLIGIHQGNTSGETPHRNYHIIQIAYEKYLIMPISFCT